MDLLRGYQPAVELLGEPIVACKVDLGTEKTQTDSLNAMVFTLF